MLHSIDQLRQCGRRVDFGYARGMRLAAPLPSPRRTEPGKPSAWWALKMAGAVSARIRRTAFLIFRKRRRSDHF
jgi:hypothetical protein